MTHIDSTAEVRLRPLSDDDLDHIFDQMRDPASVEMAAFTAEDPDDRDAFDAWIGRIRSNPDSDYAVVTANDTFVGTIASFTIEGDREISYWIDSRHWGMGFASRAVSALLETESVRPLYARAAADNIGSIKVLERNGFERIGTERGFANARGREIEEVIYRLT